MKAFIIILLLTVSSQNILAFQDNRLSSERIDALVSASGLPQYTDDGFYVTALKTTFSIDSHKIKERPVREVRNLVGLKDKAIPLLIEHLDDVRLTPASYLLNGKSIGVPVGYVCLDILLHIIKYPAPALISCSDNYLSSVCLNQEFYFRPEEFVLTDGKIAPSSRILTVKSKWRQAYREGKLKYGYVKRLK